MRLDSAAGGGRAGNNALRPAGYFPISIRALRNQRPRSYHYPSFWAWPGTTGKAHLELYLPDKQTLIRASCPEGAGSTDKSSSGKYHSKWAIPVLPGQPRRTGKDNISAAERKPSQRTKLKCCSALFRPVTDARNNSTPRAPRSPTCRHFLEQLSGQVERCFLLLAAPRTLMTIPELRESWERKLVGTAPPAVDLEVHDPRGS